MKIALCLLLSSTLLSAQSPAPAEPRSSAGSPVKPVKEAPAKEATGEKATPQQPQQGPTQGPTAGDKSGGDKTGGQEPEKSGTPADEPRIDRPDPNQPMPRGSDPADLAAMRSAEAMIAAERRLAQMIKEGKITGLDQVVTFDELSAWPYEDGLKGMPKPVKELDGKKVLMSGFMLPIDEVQNIKEFLLVQSLWSCCFGQPPDINGIVRVVMPKGRTTDYFFDPLKIVGTFRVEATVIDGYCVDIYQLDCESLEALK